jgi:hypothetical protein
MTPRENDERVVGVVPITGRRPAVPTATGIE